MKVVAVLQARMGSSRLPGKSFLDIEGIPLVILAAKRAARNGLEVRVATSVDPADDLIADAAKSEGICVVRGSKEDVLGRFAHATSDLSDDSLVIRLTGDNVFPDGDFLDIMIEEFQRRNVVYLGSGNRLPYGLAAEIFPCALLREANLKAKRRYEREHVTPWIGLNYKVETLNLTDVPENWRALRCTIDNIDDYVRVCKVFSIYGNSPIHASWRELCGILANVPNAPKLRVPGRQYNEIYHSILILGTAQLGMRYGRTNVSGCPSEDNAMKILMKAVELGVSHIDTARGYGNSERRIGQFLKRGYHQTLRVITKLDPLEYLPNEASKYCVRNAVDASVFRSCRELNTSYLDVLLLHRAKHLDAFRRCIWERLLELRDDGVIGELGISVQNVEEAVRALNDPGVRYIQLPFNVLDRRWLDSTFQSSLKGRPDVIVHARSSLLQGILAIEDSAVWPKIPGLDPDSIISKLHRVANHLGRRDLIDLSLAYVRGQEWIHSVVVGVERVEQLEDVAELSLRPALTLEERTYVEQEIEGGPEELVNPALWV